MVAGLQQNSIHTIYIQYTLKIFNKRFIFNNYRNIQYLFAITFNIEEISLGMKKVVSPIPSAVLRTDIVYKLQLIVYISIIINFVIQLVSKFNFSVFRLDKSVSRPGPQNVVFTALPWQRVHNRKFIDRLTIEGCSAQAVNREVPLLNFFIKHLRRSIQLVLVLKFTPITGELFIL